MTSETKPRWRPTPAGFELETSAMKLAITDQTARHCGWCWHVIVDGQYGSEEIGRGSGLASADEAKRAAAAWTRDYCQRTLAAIATAAGR